MNASSISQSELQNLFIKISKTTSFVERLHFVLNWTGNDFHKISFTGVSWFNETSFFIKADQLASLFGVKTETISASLRHNDFIKQYNPLQNGPRYFWTKPGFTSHGFQSKNQNQSSSTIFKESSLNTNQSPSSNINQFSSSTTHDSVVSTANQSSGSAFPSDSLKSISISTCQNAKECEKKLKTGNPEFDKISNLIFYRSDLLKCDEIIEIFYQKFCPAYIEKSSVENVFNDYFSAENCHLQNKDSDIVINREGLWTFYQHFGPLNSILAKYHLFKNYSCQDTSIKINLSDQNKFLVDSNFLVFNDFNQDVGKSYLKDSEGQSYDSWEKIIQAQNEILEMENPLSISSKYIIYPV